ncbi:MAG: FAD-dependent oxidoreductase [Clostridiales bacterium]|nr:FAD-dependent oxidoreductase [Clostridiales bacterium]
MSAYHLVEHGASVTVVDRLPPGQACSFGNAGWVTPSLANPVPEPGIFWQVLRWLVQRDSPFSMRIAEVLKDPGWFLGFLRASRPQAYEKGLRAQGVLILQGMEILSKVQEKVPFELHRDGLLYVFHTEHEYEKHLKDFERLAELGMSPPRPVLGEELLEWEPGLKPGLQKGLWVESDWHVRPDDLTGSLSAYLREKGVEFLEAHVEGFVGKNGKVKALATTAGEISGDVFLLAAGVWTGLLTRKLGVRLPLQGGKGYSITIWGAKLRLRRPLYFPDVRLACSPFEGGGLRLAGRMEIAGFDDRLDPRKVEALARSADEALVGWREREPGGREVAWTGLRPLLPDGLPAIGRLPRTENVFVAAGHGMLGITLSAPTGKAVADLMMQGKTDLAVAPFDPARFQK